MDISIRIKRPKQKKQGFKLIICLFLIFIIFLNFSYINSSSNSIEFPEESLDKDNNSFIGVNNNLKSASATSMLTDPFTANFEVLREFFENNYRSSLDFDISTYFREGNSSGEITNDEIFSEDQLLYYNSLMKMELDDFETFTHYLDLKNTTLWYEGNMDEYKYGFIQSINGTTGQIYKDERYLTDNVLPIFLLIENIGADIKTLSLDGEPVLNSINEIFYLLNSSEFWDDQDKGFYDYNSSDITNIYYTESNFYAVLANLLIHRTYYDLGLSESIRDRALELANLTINALYDNMWGGDDYAFWHHEGEGWTGGVNFEDWFHLDTNALGIITLLEYWLVSGMQNESKYLKRAKKLYNNLDTHLYNSTYNLYENRANPSWESDGKIYLENNAIMMRACLKLFEVSGNISYYERAVNMSESIESNLFDSIKNAYNFSISDDGDKSFNSNLKLTKTYLDAFDIYSSTILDCQYNISAEIPDFIINQDIMNITSVYSFKKTKSYYNPSNQSYVPFTVRYDISYATINHIIKYPSGISLEQLTDPINTSTSSYSLIYPINETFPLEDGYSVYIWANTSYFKLTESLKRFNVISGLFNKSIEGLITELIQGSIINVSVLINSTRNEGLILSASLVGEQILEYPSQQIFFTALGETRIDFNLTAKTGATPGMSDIFFRIKKGNIIYLEIKKNLEIGYPFEYNNLLYQRKVVSGDSIAISMNLKNFLPDVTQSLNISFNGYDGDYIEYFIQEETLKENEIKTVSYALKSLDHIYNETFRIKMSISIHDTEFYSKIFTIEIVPKFELISVTFPDKVPQGNPAYLIIILQNNQKHSEDFSLTLNGKSISTNLDELDTGENRIVAKIIPSINPYELGVKPFRFVLKDSSGIEIERFYFETALELSPQNLILFYVLPVIIPIGLILFFKNRDIKHKKLTR